MLINKLMVLILYFATNLVISSAENIRNFVEDEQDHGQRNPKLFVSVVVESVPCKATNAEIYGVCKSSLDCSSSNGKEIGSCDPGNGRAICCQLKRASSPSPSNITTITEPAVTLISNRIANSNSVIEIPKKTNICQLKLNFLQTELEKPNTDPLRWGECNRDAITISGSNSFTGDSFTVCGNLRDQHMYLSYGLSSTVPSDKITIKIKTTSNMAKYEINVVQLKCSSPDFAPDQCLQQYSGNKGKVKSFGFPYQLNNQLYKICTKGSPTTTSVEWKECSNLGRPFFITGVEDGGIPVPPESGNILCSYDHIQLTSSTGGGGQFSSPKLCGGGFVRTVVPGSSSELRVYLDKDEIGHSVPITNLPPSLKCSDINFLVHTCRTVTSGGEPGCVCILRPDFPIQIRIPVLETENCPRIEGFECFKTETTRCGCVQLYDEADDRNTGFCLEYTNISS